MKLANLKINFIDVQTLLLTIKTAQMTANVSQLNFLGFWSKINLKNQFLIKSMFGSISQKQLSQFARNGLKQLVLAFSTHLLHRSSFAH